MSDPRETSKRPQMPYRDLLGASVDPIFRGTLDEWERLFFQYGGVERLFREYSESNRKGLKRQHHPSSRPALCAHFLVAFMPVFQEFIAERLGTTDGIRADNTYLKAYTDGGIALLGSLMSAEKAIMGSLDEELQSEELDPKEKARAKKEAEENAKLLMQDPTGFTLLDAVSREFGRGRLTDPLEGYAFLRGAQFATSAYKTLYPHTEKP